MSNIAFIGLGHMGAPMVQNLLKHGHAVRIFDISPAAMAQGQAMGATITESPSAAVKNAEVIFTMLQTGEQVREVCLGKQGIFQHLQPEALYIDCSSIDIESTRFLHVQAQQHSIAMLDAPVSGGVKGAAAASLTIMVGGSADNFARGKALLESLGKLVLHAGGPGNGQAAKICNNLILGISMIAVSEGFALAEKLGLEAKTFFNISSHASGECWAMTHYNPVPGVLADVPANHQYRPGFTAAMMLKDLKLSQNAADNANMRTELAAKATELYQCFVDNDSTHASLDFSAIIKLVSHSDQIQGDSNDESP
jgi:3-hydroxyisobutyrate dehydrogenase